MFSTFLFRRTVLESPGMNSISDSVFFCPFAPKYNEKLKMNINGYELSNYKYPLNCNIYKNNCTEL